jgi:hypothetical protein
MAMKLRTSRRDRRTQTIELGVASTDTLGVPKGDVPEPMGFWPVGIN